MCSDEHARGTIAWDLIRREVDILDWSELLFGPEGKSELESTRNATILWAAGVRRSPRGLKPFPPVQVPLSL